MDNLFFKYRAVNRDEHVMQVSLWGEADELSELLENQETYAEADFRGRWTDRSNNSNDQGGSEALMDHLDRLATKASFWFTSTNKHPGPVIQHVRKPRLLFLQTAVNSALILKGESVEIAYFVHSD